ncbi:twin-arginine translocation signal domain-containing protein [Aquisalimonas sp. 2447]|uniref:twin-arginine translocation signal domain-containing protein n=1 Tax=Aquisalimonas sp. 2447 TaxID=2740807 RepID=UPI0014326078|nr:twin-arginine translocation signal domain-containing protein [Aquisalimonas sp. 2447]QIT54762.1 twin-arginine translocation signal domain-containing protein [Aquisalimonas sp. 2447]
MSKTNGDFKADASRRRFLRGVAMTGGAAVFAAGTGGAFAAETDTAEAPRETEGKAGYHETKHIRDYYQRADF